MGYTVVSRAEDEEVTEDVERFAEDLQRYAALHRRRTELEVQLRAVNDQIDALQPTLMDDFSRQGITSLTVDGRTVYLHRRTWATVRQGVDRREVVDVLRSSGLGHFVSETFNTNTLSAYVRELEEEGEGLPDELDRVVKVSEVYSLRVRKAG
jgi:hypothetical protein